MGGTDHREVKGKIRISRVGSKDSSGTDFINPAIKQMAVIPACRESLLRRIPDHAGMTTPHIYMGISDVRFNTMRSFYD